MLSAIVAASCSTANGVILGTACVAVRNIAGLEQQTDPDVPNDLFGPGFDGWPTFISPVASLVAFAGVALLAPRREPVPEPSPAVA